MLLQEWYCKQFALWTSSAFVEAAFVKFNILNGKFSYSVYNNVIVE